MKKILTKKEVAEYLGVEEGTIDRMRKKADLPSFIVGHTVRFRLKDVDKWIGTKMVTKDSEVRGDSKKNKDSVNNADENTVTNERFAGSEADTRPKQFKVFKHKEIGQLRVAVDVDDTLWFSLYDIDIALGYWCGNTRRHLSPTNKVKKYFIVPTVRSMQHLSFCDEKSLFQILDRKIMRRNAQEMKRWVTDFIIPMMRNKKDEQKPVEKPVETKKVTEQNGYEKHKEAVWNSLSAVNMEVLLLEKRVDVLEEKMAQNNNAVPKVLSPKNDNTGNNSISMEDLPKLFQSVGVNATMQQITECIASLGYIYKDNTMEWWMPTKKALEVGFFEEKCTYIRQPNGSTHVIKTAYVTSIGQQYFIDCIRQRQGSK